MWKWPEPAVNLTTAAARTPVPGPGPDPRRWITLAIVITSIFIVVLALNGLMAGCQKREPTRPAQPTVSGATERRQTPEAEPQRNARIARFEGSVRKRHFDLP